MSTFHILWMVITIDLQSWAVLSPARSDGTNTAGLSKSMPNSLIPLSLSPRQRLSQSIVTQSVKVTKLQNNVK